MRLIFIITLAALSIMPIAAYASCKTMIDCYQQALIDLKRAHAEIKAVSLEAEKKAAKIESLIAKYESALKTTTDDLVTAYQTQLESLEKAYATRLRLFEEAYVNKMVGDAKKMEGNSRLAQLSLELAQQDAKAIKALLDELGTSAEKVAKVTKAVSVSAEGNVNVMPKTALEVSGNLKMLGSANGIVFPDGSKQTRSPRVIYTPDTRDGCPPSGAANTDLWKQTFTLSNTANIVTLANAISFHGGRQDLFLYVDGQMKNRALTDDADVKWQDLHLHWGGPLSPGEHTISLRSDVANVIGCKETWGNIMTLIFE
jgi:Skp family chaperone for outer membrane proteins